MNEYTLWLWGNSVMRQGKHSQCSSLSQRDLNNVNTITVGNIIKALYSLAAYNTCIQCCSRSNSEIKFWVMYSRTARTKAQIQQCSKCPLKQVLAKFNQFTTLLSIGLMYFILTNNSSKFIFLQSHFSLLKVKCAVLLQLFEPKHWLLFTSGYVNVLLTAP